MTVERRTESRGAGAAAIENGAPPEPRRRTPRGALAALAALLTAAAAAPAAGQISALRPGDVFSHCELRCPEMVIVPGGTFEMGSPPDEVGRDDDEGPTREVTVPSFAMAITETTFNQWDLCVADGYCKPAKEDLGFGKGRGRRPVIGVSWRDIVGTPRVSKEDPAQVLPPTDGFLAWMNSKVDGAPYRLPTEAEWEYALRAGSQKPYYTGNSITAHDANFNPNPRVGEHVEGPYRGRTIAVGGLPPNRFGLFEMAGNAWEWVQDCYRPDYKGAPTNGAAVEEADCKDRALRGGSYVNYPIGMRSANRYHFNAEESLGAFGFRVVYDLTPKAFD